jgi:anti-anti-sigma factor
MNAEGLFTLHSDGQTMTIEVHGAVGSLSDGAALRNLDHILQMVRESGVRDVVIDFLQSPYFGSSLLEMLRCVWNELHSRGGHMVLCNLSPVGAEIIQLAKFDHLWPVVATRADAQHRLQSLC